VRRLLRVWPASGLVIGVGVGFLLGCIAVVMDRHFVHQIVWAPALVGGMVGLLVGAAFAISMCLVVSVARLFKRLRALLESWTAPAG
jgi:hypothetical protein